MKYRRKRYMFPYYVSCGCHPDEQDGEMECKRCLNSLTNPIPLSEVIAPVNLGKYKYTYWFKQSENWYPILIARRDRIILANTKDI